MGRKIRLATRGSPLALKQAYMTRDLILAKFPDAEVEIVEIRTSGDKRLDWSLEKFGGKGLFTKEIEDALFAGEADLAVHSAKDLPTDTPQGLSICALLERDACRDVMATRQDIEVPTLIASSSPRRRAQLKRMFPQAVWCEIRGNVDTRLKKIVGGTAEATLLSEAGLARLGITEFEGIKFTPLKLDVCVPAVGQGIIALESLAARAEEFAFLNNAFASEAFAYEREFLTALGGGCQVAYAANYDGEIFRFFHETCGHQKLKFEEGTSVEERLEVVRNIASSFS